MTMGDQAGEGSAPAAGSKGLSFGFSKKLTNKVQKADQTSWKKDKDSHPDETSVDLVKEVNAKGVQSTKAPEIKKAAVIPCPGKPISVSFWLKSLQATSYFFLYQACLFGPFVAVGY